ncbi:MAG: TraR/DksA family transcriptional regulator [Bryobacteraceae bacterium]
MTRVMQKGATKTIDKYRRILEQKVTDVRRSLSAQNAAAVVARLDVPSDEGDLSQQSHEEWIFLNRNKLDITLLRQVQEALHRIRHGTFGVCGECDEPISPKRLDAVPWAKYCVKCQEMIGSYSAEHASESK